MADSIMKVAMTLPEGVPLAAKGLLHLGSRAAVDQTLSRLAARGELIRAGRGLYMRPVQTRFGPRSPSTEQAIEALAFAAGRDDRAERCCRGKRSGPHDAGAGQIGLSHLRTKPCAEPWPARCRTASCAALAVSPWQQDLRPGCPRSGLAWTGRGSQGPANLAIQAHGDGKDGTGIRCAAVPDLAGSIGWRDGPSLRHSCASAT